MMTDRVEALLKLADMSWRDYGERRAIEWKINFGLWLALGSFAGFMFQHPMPLPLPYWIAIPISALLLCTFLVYTFLWKSEIKDRNSFDKRKVQYYWGKVDEELDTHPPSGSTLPKDIKWPNTHLSQVLITFLFVLLAIFAVWAPRWL
jgi:hypothetical protein